MGPRVFCLRDPAGVFRLGLVVKRAYRVCRAACLPLAEVPAFTEVACHVPSQNRSAHERLAADSDLFAPLKPSTDVLIQGTAHALRGPVRSLDTGVRIGPLRKQVRVIGDRRIQLGPAGHLVFSGAEPFTRMPLLWDHAYGGRDGDAEKGLRARASNARADRAAGLGAVAYPRNPSGRGFSLDVDRERLGGTPAPNLEDPEDPVTPNRLLAVSPLDWCDRPVAASYGPVDWLSFPRVALWLGIHHDRPKNPLVELRRGVLRPEDLRRRPLGAAPDARAYNCGSMGLSGVRLTGGERASLWNMHPKHEVWEVELPSEKPTLGLSPPGCGVFNLPALLQTVLIEPDEDRVTLTWSGSLEVAAPYPEEMCDAMERAVKWER